MIAAGDAAEGVEIPDDINVVAEYPIAWSPTHPTHAGGRAFIDFVLGASGPGDPRRVRVRLA